MRNFKDLITNSIIPFSLILTIQILKLLIRPLASSLNQIIVVFYLCLLATKTKNTKLLTGLIGFAIFISLATFDLFPKEIVETYYGDHRLNTYLPVLIIIAISELVLSNSTIFMLVDRKVFLTIFRIKNIVTLLIVPRLWLGDQS
jgi:hypothetical protein